MGKYDHSKKYEEFREVLHGKVESLLNSMGFSTIEKADPRSKGLAFLRFYLYDVFSSFCEIDSEEIEAGIVDKQNDLGIDFINITENNIYIIQSKYIKHFDNLKEVLEHFIQLPQLIQDKKYIGKAHADLKNILDEIEKIKNPSYKMIFITSAKIDREKISYYENRETPLDVTYSILSFSELGQEYRRVQSLSDLPPEEVILSLGNEDYVELQTTDQDYNTILFTQKGSKLKSLYLNNDIKERLFNHNIRFWLGKNAVNSGMIKTIEQEPERFIYYNNGITAICDEYELIEDKEKKLKCKNFQIINGAQTVTTIAKQRENSKLSDVKVVVKLIQGERGKKAKRDTSINENIVKYCNSQTAINVSDFRSNDSIQISIEQAANQYKFTLLSPFKDVFYKRKRRKELPKATKVISMQDIGKAYYSYKYNPSDLNDNINLLWDISVNGKYYYVFGDEGRQVETISPKKVIEMLGVFYIYEYIKEKLKKFKKEESPSVLFKFHLLRLVGVLLNNKYPDNTKSYDILKQILENGIFINNKVNDEKERAFFVYVDKTRRFMDIMINQAKKDTPTFVIRNYQRSHEFSEEIEKNLLTWISMDELPQLI